MFKTLFKIILSFFRMNKMVETAKGETKEQKKKKISPQNQ